MGQKSSNFVRNCVLWYQVKQIEADFRRSPENIFGKMVTVFFLVGISDGSGGL